MKKLFTSLALFSIASLVSITAQADASNYNYVEGSYIEVESEDGLKFSGSLQFSENVFTRASYWDIDQGPYSLSRTMFAIGALMEASSNATIYGLLGYTDLDAQISGLGSGSVDGWTGAVGIRSDVSENLELNAEASRDSLESSIDSTTISVGGVYTLTENLGITGKVGNIDFDGEDGTLYTLGVRFSF